MTAILMVSNPWSRTTPSAARRSARPPPADRRPRVTTSETTPAIPPSTANVSSAPLERNQRVADQAALAVAGRQVRGAFRAPGTQAPRDGADATRRPEIAEPADVGP